MRSGHILWITLMVVYQISPIFNAPSNLPGLFNRADYISDDAEYQKLLDSLYEQANGNQNSIHSNFHDPTSQITVETPQSDRFNNAADYITDDAEFQQVLDYLASEHPSMNQERGNQNSGDYVNNDASMEEILQLIEKADVAQASTTKNSQLIDETTTSTSNTQTIEETVDSLDHGANINSDSATGTSSHEICGVCSRQLSQDSPRFLCKHKFHMDCVHKWLSEVSLNVLNSFDLYKSNY